MDNKQAKLVVFLLAGAALLALPLFVGQFSQGGVRIMAIALAAISSSRIAIQARPMRERSRRKQISTLNTTRPRNSQ